jgi:hypothetical protein
MQSISLDMQQNTLKLLRDPASQHLEMTGIIIKIENVGHMFYWGANIEDLEKSSIYFLEKKLKYAFSVVEAVYGMPAGKLMEKIHQLNSEAGLPGILKYLESQQKAA